jgi:hypothetical protein
MGNRTAFAVALAAGFIGGIASQRSARAQSPTPQEQSKAAVIQKAQPAEPIPIPTAQEQGKILDDVRQYVANYDNNLPNFTCVEVEQRMVASRKGGRSGSEPSYRLQDTVTSKVTYFQHKEEKTPILNGGRPVTGSYESLGGAMLRGDFETTLLQLFDAETQVRFQWARWATLRGRRTMVFSYQVPESRSRYKIGVSDPKIERITAYSGEVYVDAEPAHAVTRLKTKAEEIPEGFPIRNALTTLDYAYTDVGGQQFLLPLKEEVELDLGKSLAKNYNSFLQYRKHEAPLLVPKRSARYRVTLGSYAHRGPVEDQAHASDSRLRFLQFGDVDREHTPAGAIQPARQSL